MLSNYTTNEPNLLQDKNQMLAKLNKLIQFLTISLLMSSVSAIAATSADEEQPYIDSLNSWGAWELGLEPAAGGAVPSPTRALTSRAANIQFRSNDNSAFSPQSKPVVRSITRPTPMPAPIPAPTSGPAGNGPLPTGGPGDRF